MNHVLTLVAAQPEGLTPAIVAEAGAALNAESGVIGEPHWLASGKACDIPFSADDITGIRMAVRAAINGPEKRIDLHAGPTFGRRKKLLLADMDSTIVTSETLDELAAFAGLKDEVAAITTRAMNGELDFEASVRERVRMLTGLDESLLARTFEDVELTSGAETLVRTMAANDARCVLVSGGFKYFTSRVAKLCGFHFDFANDFVIEDGKLTGDVAAPILTRHAKLDNLEAQAEELGLSLNETVAVGDGANDLLMIQAAGLGAAFHGKPLVAEMAPARIDHGDLMALLYYQGYSKSEFVNVSVE
ncbi:MAG: phosphoserine phosphatase SerB [Rhodospirillaceae bacterium]|nr:phosphoserine phosphatase SerB [Rhodospirillaceae bacterium]